MRKQLDASNKLAFATIDKNHDGKIDAQEQAAVFAYMDTVNDKEFNGRISLKGYNSVSERLGDSDSQENTKKKLSGLYDQFFGAE